MTSLPNEKHLIGKEVFLLHRRQFLSESSFAQLAAQAEVLYVGDTAGGGLEGLFDG